MIYKPIRIRLIDEAEKEFKELNRIVKEEQSRSVENSESQQLLRAINRAVELIKDDPKHGIRIKTRQIPKKYGVNNLWKVNLTGYWRMLYTLKGEALEILCFVLEICDHDDYDKLFGYKKQ